MLGLVGWKGAQICHVDQLGKRVKAAGLAAADDDGRMSSDIGTLVDYKNREIRNQSNKRPITVTMVEPRQPSRFEKKGTRPARLVSSRGLSCPLRRPAAALQMPLDIGSTVAHGADGVSPNSVGGT